MSKLVTLGQLGEILNIPAHKIDNALKANRLPCKPQRVGRIRFVTTDQIDGIRAALVEHGYLRASTPVNPIEEILHAEAAVAS